MLRVVNVYKTYSGNKDPTLKDINITINDTGLYYLLGKSGSGKSTLLAILGGMDDNYSGQVIYEGKNLRQLNDNEIADYRYHNISFVFQDYQVIEKETVLSNLLKPLAISRLSYQEKKKIILEKLQLVGLQDKVNARFNELSGGEKKRIALARGLVKDSPLLLADEPLASLNKNMRASITDLLVKESQKKAVFIITHEEEDIPKTATIYRLKDGKLHLETSNHTNTKSQIKVPKRKAFSFLDIVRELKDSLVSKKQFLSIAIISLVISLFSITFSFLLSGGVKSSLENTITSFMNSNSLVLTNKDVSYQGTMYESADYHFLNLLKERYPQVISSVSDFYLTSTDEIFLNDQSISLIYSHKNYPLKRFSSNNFLEALALDEKPENSIIYGSIDLEQDELILGLSTDEILALILLVNNGHIEELTEENLQHLGYILANQIITININFNKGEWGYYLDYSFRLKGFFISDKPYVLSTDDDFNSYFVNEILHFKTALLEEETSDVPWTLKYQPGLRLKTNKVGEFIKLFLNDKNCNIYVPQVLTKFNYYNIDDIKTHNRILIYKDYLPKLNIDIVKLFADNLMIDLDTIKYSSAIYTYTVNGYISGFSTPILFSANLEELNYIEDNYQFSDIDLGSFQGSLIETNEKVLKADLLSALEEEGMSFKVLKKNSIIIGQKPQNENEIIISSKLAQKLYSSTSKALNNDLYSLTLNKTTKEANNYKNNFVSGILKVVGVIEDDALSIYQDSLFPLCYAFSHLELTPEEVRVNAAIIDVDLENNSSDYYLKKADELDLLGDFPVDSMLKELEKTLSNLSMLFLAFSVLGLITSSFLLFLALYLIYNKDKKALGTLLALGYYQKEISKFYFFLASTITFFSYVLSVAISLLTELLLSSTLTDLLNTYTFSVFPYLISFLTSFSICIIISLALKLKLKKLTPKDALFKK